MRQSGPLTGKDLSVFCSNGHVWAVAGYEINTNFEVRYELGSLLFPYPLTEDDLEPEVETPLFTEPVLGYRTWYANEGSLRPISFGEPWVPGVNTAKCAVGGHGSLMIMTTTISRGFPPSFPPPGHQAPHPDCSCGLHAYHVYEPYSRLGRVQGAIRAWGDMEVYARGFRAQHASIIALADDEMPYINKVARKYDVPVVPMEELVAVGQEHASPLPKMDLGPPKKPIRSGFVCGSLVAVRPIGGIWKCRCARCLKMVSVTPTALSAGTAECLTCVK